MSLILTFLGLILVSCGPRKAPSNDIRFDVIKKEFQREASKRGVEITDGELSIPISFGAVGSQNDGICIVPGMGRNAFSAAANTLFNKENYEKKFIQIDPAILEKDLFYIEAVVFHELAHCLMGRGHTHENSLMNESQEENTDYPLKRTHYLDELFGLDANFSKFGRLDFCPEFEAANIEIETVEESNYVAFGRELSHGLYNLKSRTEGFCVVAKLKR